MMRWTQLRRSLWQWRGILLAVPTVTTGVVVLRLLGLLQPLEWAALDLAFRLRPTASQDDRIVIVAIQEPDLQKYGYPQSDEVLAKLIQKISSQQPRAIGLDIYRNLPVEPGTARLKEVFESTPQLVGIQKVGGSPLETVPPSPVLNKLGQISANDVVQDGDAKIRRGLLYLSDREQQNLPTLGMAMALLYLDAEGIQPELTEQEHIKLGQTVFPPLEANDGGYVQTQAQGYQILLDYRGGRGSFRTVSMDQVLQGQVDPDVFRDRVVLIGATAESLRDFFDTPFSTRFFQRELPMPGVEIHAQLTSQVLSAVLQKRPLIQTWSEGWEWLWIGAWSVVGALLVWQQRSSSEKAESQRKSSVWALPPVRITIGFLLAGGTVIGISYGAFLASWWIPVIPALMSLSGGAIAVIAYLAQTAAELRKTLGRYLTDAVVASLLETPEGLHLEGETRKVTTLISDLRGFTSISAHLPPAQVVRMLNIYLEEMIQVIQNYGGTINDVTGDGLVVFFGAPMQQSDDSLRAVACAVAMQLAMETVNQRNQQFSLPALEMGIGINTGDVVVGNIGCQHLTKYTAIGNHVNIAARVESFSVGGQILISETTFEEVKSIARIDGQTEARMKGLSTPVQLYEVSGMGEPYRLFLPEEQASFISLKREIPFQYQVLEGKHLADAEFSGSLIKLSAKGAQVQSDFLPPPLTNLKLTLILQRTPQQTPDDRGAGFEAEEVQELGEIYAKVISTLGDNSGFYMRFTMVPPQVLGYLQALRSDRRARQ